jgi:glycosyltransferase involved in cell wall biosynthesis
VPQSDSGTRPGLVVYQDTGGVDAIEEYSRRLVQALCEIGAPARYAGDIRALSKTAGRAPWILLQYNPLSYGRWGFAPMLVRDAIAMRRRTGARFVLSVHEPWVDTYDWRSAVMSGYHRVQLRPLLAMSDAIVTTTDALAATLGRGATPVALGTTVTPVEEASAAAREQLGLRGRFVVALFGRAHPSRALDYAEQAIADLSNTAVGERLTVLNVGDLAPELELPPCIDVRTLGHLDPGNLSRALRASHLLLLPFTDGVSTRRTTLMAGLAHGVPVVGLRGDNTDAVLARSDALVLTPVGDRGAFAHAVSEVAADPARMQALGAAGRRLYLTEFDWPVVARRVRDVVTTTPR